jgi:hypothetical protein
VSGWEQASTHGVLPAGRTARSDMPEIRLAIASEYPIIRTSLATLLHQAQGFNVVAEVDLSNFIIAPDRQYDVALPSASGPGKVKSPSHGRHCVPISPRCL